MKGFQKMPPMLVNIELGVNQVILSLHSWKMDYIDHCFDSCDGRETCGYHMSLNSDSYFPFVVFPVSGLVV